MLRSALARTAALVLAAVAVVLVWYAAVASDVVALAPLAVRSRG